MIDSLLSRLKKVTSKTRGNWIACCPAHDDRSPSMTIKLADDGRILMHCFAGCDTSSILDAVGMDFTELFPDQKPLYHRAKPMFSKFSPLDVLKVIRQEAVIVGLASIDLKNGKQLSDEDHQRLLTAIGRISEGVNYAE